jgi:hypothetical protein
LPNFPSFPVHENNAEIRWAKWISRLENLYIGSDNKDKKRQRPLLLHYAGEDVNEIFDTLTYTGENYATAKLKLKEYFAPMDPMNRFSSLLIHFAHLISALFS